MDSKLIESEAEAMAVAINGGLWEKDYTVSQQEGWRLKVKWAFYRYGSKNQND